MKKKALLLNSSSSKRCLDATLLIVEDDLVASSNMQRYFAPFFRKTWVCHTAADAWEIYETQMPSVVISDIELPHGNGIELIQKIRKKDATLPVFIVTAFPKEAYLLDAILLKLENFVIKPLTSLKLQSIVDACFKLLLKEEVCLGEDAHLYYSYAKKIISSNDEIIVLTHLEITIFEVLLQAKNSILSYEQLESVLALENSFSRNSLRVLIARLRKKHPAIRIENHPYEGYMLRC